MGDEFQPKGSIAVAAVPFARDVIAPWTRPEFLLDTLAPDIMMAYVNELMRNSDGFPAATFDWYDMPQEMDHESILYGLGKGLRPATSSIHMFQLLLAQGSGELDGPLLVDGMINTFYIVSDKPELRIVVDCMFAEYGWWIGHVPEEELDPEGLRRVFAYHLGESRHIIPRVG